MKLNQLGKLAKRDNILRLYKMPGEQWAVTKSAAYHLGMAAVPYMDSAEDLAMICGIDAERRQTIDLRTESRTDAMLADVSAADSDPTDCAAEPMQTCLIHNGIELVPMMAEDGTLGFVDPDALNPIRDALNPHYMTWSQRRTKTGIVYLVRNGFDLAAIVCPYIPDREQLHDDLIAMVEKLEEQK